MNKKHQYFFENMTNGSANMMIIFRSMQCAIGEFMDREKKQAVRSGAESSR